MLVLGTLLAACQPQSIPGPGIDPVDEDPTAWPDPDYLRASEAGKDVFLFDPDSSRIDILVRREGPLARFGHDHVIVARNAEGFLLFEQPLHGSRADLRIDIDNLHVDPAEARQRYRLNTEPDAEDIAATRENLRFRVLESARWPYIFIGVSDISEEGDTHSARLDIAVRDSVISRREDFQIGFHGRELVIEGSLKLLQTELGLEPFSVLGGGLRVADELEIHFSLRWRPMEKNLAD